jgi:hypothetical protein
METHMILRKQLVILVSLLAFTLQSQGQRIFYSDIEKDDYRQTNFEILGKVGSNISVYKNMRNRNDVSIYDNEMKLINKVRLDFLPDKIINADFIVYPNSYWMIYQHQKRNAVYCTAVHLDGNGKVIKGPVDLDTSQVGGFGDNKIYTTVWSDDEQQVMVFKINRRDERRLNFTLLRFNGKDADLRLAEKNELSLASSERDRESVFTEFIIDNDGDFVFGKMGRAGSREYINRLDVYVKRPGQDTFISRNLPLNDKTLDEVKIKADNVNKRFIFNSFFYQQKRGNIDGIVNLVFDKKEQKISAVGTVVFNDTMRLDARSENAPIKQAFNDYFIKQVIPKRDGGFAVLAELYYTSSRQSQSGWNRWDYLYGYNYFNPNALMYYTPYSGIGPRWMDPWNRWGNNLGNTMVRHYAENVVIMSFNKDAQLEWSNFVRKTQFDDNSDIFLSYNIFFTGREVRFLFNTLERRELLLNSVTVNAEGVMKRDPTMKSMDRNYEFMPKFGKQVGANTVVLPTMYKNFICFAKVDF